MANESKTKLKLLYLSDILNGQTDENHPLSSYKICDLLSEKGILAERKSIYTDIAVLNEYGMDIIVNAQNNSKGFFVGSRQFELAEIRLLLDAVQAADFISPNKTKQLVKKIEGFTSVYQQKKLHRQVYVDNRPKCKNEEIFYNINTLDDAINKKVKVTFKYTRRKLTDEFTASREEKVFLVSPYALIWSADHYYLVCNNEKYDNLMNLRIDRIKNVNLTELPARHFSEVSDYESKFDSADYSSKLFNMYSGEPEPVELECDNGILEEILDKFGDKVKLRKSDDEHFYIKTDIAVSDGLVGWILQFGKKIKVVSPVNLADKVKEKAEEILNSYFE